MTPAEIITDAVVPELRKLAKGAPHFVAEWGVLQGEAIADLAMVDDHHLHLVEVKSEADDLRRLVYQSVTFSNAGDFCYLFAAPKHCDGALEILPPWWGIYAAARVGTVMLRAPEPKPPDVSTVHRVRLLWVDELRALFKAKGIKSSGSKPELVTRALKHCSTGELFAPLRARIERLSSTSPCRRNTCWCTDFKLRDVAEIAACLPSSTACVCGHTRDQHRWHPR